MAEQKKYSASVNIEGFYYGEVGEGTVAAEVHHVKFMQEITVEAPQEITKAYGDGEVAEMAVAGGDVSVKGKFHAIPVEDKERLFGFEKVDGILAMGSKDNPPLVGTIFTKTFKDGAKEYVGLLKGMYTRPSIGGQSSEEGKVEFSSDEIEGQFMDREVNGFTEKKTVLMGRDEKGETTVRDAMFQKVFGMAFPTGTTTPEGA
ncbi:major tail protein [Priestia megaterium]|uniref:major tail protein n=1 Tax=Priestia megaterium TaxID=1404 RepID=UPI000BFC043F|nr:major tail protein [Priestia megaterium]PGR01349.1 phage tail protein [Priestia megaterium]